MKILLVGEYNRSHTFLKEGLERLGHEATVIGLNDGFKKVDVDIKIKNYFQFIIFRKIKNLIYRLLKIDIYSISIYLQILKSKKKFSEYDIIQFINESSFLCTPKFEEKIFKLITQSNPNVFLLSCGTDHISVKYAYDKKFEYSILTPYFEKKEDDSSFAFGLKFLRKDFIKLHEFIYSRIKGVIASDLDYHIPLNGHSKYLGMISNPINIDTLKYQYPVINDKIIIFHGINTNNYYKKGNDLFEKALSIVAEKHASKIKIITVKSIPYKEYINAYNNAHILLDQVYAYDQGYNALEAMAKGKVVFTGAEQEWLEWYNVKEDTIAINALPDAEAIAKKLEWLILNPEQIIMISNNARAFVEKEHHYVLSAKKYLEKWDSVKS